MPAVNQIVENLGEIEPGQYPILVSDCDSTLFPHNSAELYTDAAELIDRLKPEVITLVSANPNKQLAEARAEVVEGYSFTPRLPNWIKLGLYKTATDKIKELTDADQALVLGDRWAMDVVVARFVLFNSGINNHGVLVRRPETSKTVLIDHVVSPVEFAAAALLKKSGYDHIIRPRKQEIAA